MAHPAPELDPLEPEEPRLRAISRAQRAAAERSEDDPGSRRLRWPRFEARGLLGLLWLVPAGLLLLLASGRWMVPAAAWLAPLFMLRFFRTHDVRLAAAAALVVALPAAAAAWWGLIPLHGVPYLAVATVIAVATLLPYVVDRLLAPRLRGWGSSLVLPVAAVAVEFLGSSANPYGTWGAVAYTQVHDLPLMQLVSVTGLWGVTFLVCWFASVANMVWERGVRDRGARLTAIAFVLAWIGVQLVGGIRLARDAERDTIRIASFTMTPNPPLPLDELLRRRFEGPDLSSLRGRLDGIQASLFARATHEAKSGAQVVFWSEANAIVLDTEMESFVSEAAGLAHDEGVFLGMAFAAVTPGAGSYEDRLMIIDPDGRVVVDQHKSRPLPGEALRGVDRHVPVVETPLGVIAATIGSDADFPSLVREAGQSRADVLIVPASDRKQLASIHARMASVRGIENGCAVVRQTSQGRSVASDAKGRTIASVNYLEDKPCVMVAQVPKQGVRTVYSRVGDLFAWLCLVFLAVFVGLGLRAPRTAGVSRAD